MDQVPTSKAQIQTTIRDSNSKVQDLVIQVQDSSNKTQDLIIQVQDSSRVQEEHMEDDNDINFLL